MSNVSQYTFATTVVVAACATLAAVFLEGTGVIKSAALVDDYGRPIPQTIDVFCAQDNCVFGWMARKWALKILLFGLVIGVVCIAGFNYAMQYLPPLVFSSISLLDPALTAIISWVAGVEALPTLYSWFGGATVMVGVAIISIGEHPHDSDDEHPPVRAEDIGSAIDVSLHDGGRPLDANEEERAASPPHDADVPPKSSAATLVPPARHLFSVVSEDDGDDDEESRGAQLPSIHSPLQAELPLKKTASSIAGSAQLSSLQERYRRLQDMDAKGPLAAGAATPTGYAEEKPQVSLV